MHLFVVIALYLFSLFLYLLFKSLMMVIPILNVILVWSFFLDIYLPMSHRLGLSMVVHDYRLFLGHRELHLTLELGKGWKS